MIAHSFGRAVLQEMVVRLEIRPNNTLFHYTFDENFGFSDYESKQNEDCIFCTTLIVDFYSDQVF